VDRFRLFTAVFGLDWAFRPAQCNAYLRCSRDRSALAGTSSSIEPFFALALARRVRWPSAHRSESLLERSSSGWVPRRDRARSVQEHGSLRHAVTHLPELRRCFPVAVEIAPEWHVRMQAAFQEHVDAAVSKTVNSYPRRASRARYASVHLARELHLKGITVYRYGSRPGQILSLIEERARPDCRSARCRLSQPIEDERDQRYP
jgi:ribonucleoside-diphosphate reductase alpha chain